MDPAVKAALLACVANIPSIEPGCDIVAIRSKLARLTPTPQTVPRKGIARVFDTCVKGGPPVRVYMPDSAAHETVPVIVYAHGGGWVLGTLAMFDAWCQAMCAGTGCAIVSVDYRLAPVHPHPAALEDVLAATMWVRCGNLPGVNADRLALAGDSAGGNLAAAAALQLPPGILHHLVLLYPALDARCFTASFESHATDGFLTATAMRYMWDLYAGDDETYRNSATVSPGCAPSLDALPPTHILIVSHDPLHDEGLALAYRMGSRATLQRVEGMFHGFLGILSPDMPPVAAAVRELFERVHAVMWA